MNLQEDPNGPTAYVTKDEAGRVILVDPHAEAAELAICKHNCQRMLDANADRIEHFKRRIVESGHSPKDVVIVLLNVDDSHGAILADLLMPGQDWQAYRDRGETPVARGLAGRIGILASLEIFDTAAATKLRNAPDALGVVVVDCGVAEVYFEE